MASMQIEINGFPVPEEVTMKMAPGRRQDGIRQAPTFKLHELSDDTLAALIEEFATNVMAAARPTK